MADFARGPKKQKMQLAMEEEELRSLRIPSSAHRGNLSPSKNSYLPTLQEQAQERAGSGSGRRSRSRLGEKAAAESGTLALTGGGPGEEAAPAGTRETSDAQLLASMSADLLEGVKQDFIREGGALELDQFARAMLRNLEPANPSQSGDAGKKGRSSTGVRFSDAPCMAVEDSIGGYPSAPSTTSRQASSDRSAVRAAAVVDLFRRVDVHSEGSITWDEVSNYLIEQGMAGGDQFTVDSIKTYEPSNVVDNGPKHESSIEKLVFLEQMDTNGLIVCMSHNSRNFRLYDPKRCTLKHEVAGHRGTVINCCYVDAFHQVATTSADMTVCMWDATHLGLRNRMATKEVQLCLQWDNASGSLFSGSIDGTLSRWDLQNMCLADTRRGQHKKAINDLLMVQDMNLLASASSDGSILMWDTATMRPKKTFKGHKKGTFSLAYSTDYRCLLTAGLDREALVWNPYVERVPIFRLKGHTSALCGVAVVPGTPQILSADVAGMFRLWDMRNFRCVQSFGGVDEAKSHELNTFCAMPMHRRLAAGGSRVVMYDYMDEWGGESVTDTGGVTDALYNPKLGEFYTVSKQSVKAWNAGTGTLFKVMRDIAKNEITAACLADNGRKFYLGEAGGKVGVHDLNNGSLLRELERHATDISCLSVWPGTNKVFSSSWDGTVKVHTDEGHRQPQVKAIFQNHRDGVTCMACSPELMLLATGGTDMKVCFYDLKTLKLDNILKQLPHVISGLDFHSSRCLLAMADQGGYVSLWRVRPHPDKWARVHHFKNLPLVPGLEGELRLPMHNEEKGSPVPLSTLRFAPAAAREEGPLLYTADAKGGLRCWDLLPLCERRGVFEVDLAELFERQYAAQLAAASSPAAGTALQRAKTQSPPVDTGAAVENKPSAFLTGVDAELPDGGRDSRSSDAPPQRTTVRSAVVKRPSSIGVGVGDSVTNAASAVCADFSEEVKLFSYVEGHEDAVLSLHVTKHPMALLTCGHDRRVRTWGTSLDCLGLLLQSKDQAFRFPYNPQQAQQAKQLEGAELLKRIGPWTPGPRLPPLAPSGARSPNETLACLAIGGKRKSRMKKDPDAMWKVAAEHVIADDEAGEEDYRILFDQMERLGVGPEAEPMAETSAPDRLHRHAHSRHAERMTHRTTALSRDEAAAADRLARAMAALGGDDFGTYSAMAKSIAPKARAPAAAAADEDE